MKALCCICFNLLDGSHIAACPCGHTFHEECLMRWIDTCSTCPNCRTHVNKDQIIKRLFFDINEHCDEDVDVAMMINQINNLKARLSKKDKQRQELVESRNRLSTMFADSEAARELLLTKLTEEKNSKNVIERDLNVMLWENTVFLDIMKKIRKIVKNCERLPSFETLMKECENHVKQVGGHYTSGGESSLRQLDSFLTDLKLEYYQELSEKAICQKQVSEIKWSAERNKMYAEVYKQTIIDLRTGLKTVHENVIEMQRQNAHFYGEIVALKESIVGNDTGTEKILQELKDLRKKYIDTFDTLSKMQAEVCQPFDTRLKSALCNSSKIAHTCPRDIKPNMHGCMENTTKCMSPDITIRQKKEAISEHVHQSSRKKWKMSFSSIFSIWPLPYVCSK